MRRRALLAALGAGAAGLAGCHEASPDGRTAVTDTAPVASISTTAGGELAVEPGAVDAPDLDWTVEKLAPPTEDRPCRLRIALANTGQRRDFLAAGELPYPITPGDPADGDGGVVPAIVPVDSDYERRFDGDCWQAPLDDPDIADDAPWDWGYGEDRTYTLDAGERIERTYHLVGSRYAYCYQRGEYLFDRRYELDGREYEWTFSLHVPAYSRDVEG